MILAFLALIPASKHFHLVLSPITVFLRSLELGNVPNLDFEKEEVGLETVKDLGSKTVLDALTCVECGRCQVNCPAWGAGKELNPKTIILQTQQALLGGRAREEAGRGLYREGPLAVHDLRRLREPVSGRHRASAAHHRRAARPGVERRRARVYGRRLQPPRAARQYLGPRPTISARSSSIRRRSRCSIRRSTTCWSGSAAPARSRPTSRSRCARCSRSCARASVRFGVLSKERCTGDPAKRTGNEYMFQELATANIADLKAAGPKKILASCPHCVKTIGDDYRRFGYDVEIVHSAVFVEELTRDASDSDERGVRAELHRDLPRSLLSRPLRRKGRRAARAADAIRRDDRRAGPQSRESVLLRRRRRPAVRRQGRGARLPHQRRALQAAAGRPGASTVVTACPFCSIMLKGAQRARRRGRRGDVQFVDLMTYVNGTADQALTWRSCGRAGLARPSRRGSVARSAQAGDRQRRLPPGRGARRRRCAGGPRASSTSTASLPTAASRSWRSGTAAFCRRPTTSARRGIVVITSENFDGEWIAGIIERFGYGTARGSTSRGGAAGAAAVDARHGGRQAGRLHRGRPARSGARRAARRGLAGEGDRQSGSAVSSRGRPPLDAAQLGSHADSQAVRDRGDGRSASRSTSPPTPTRRPSSGAPVARGAAARARRACSTQP